MCGICGVFRYGGGAPVTAPEITGMAATLRHRGPDGQGTHLDGCLGLGHRRLKIIDLSNAAAQPMTNEDETLWLTFNGEIYNYRALTAELIAAGHRFRSRSDSEVILHAYEQWGEDCLNRFNGEWAFALWDARRNRLFCARDRFGIKPFQYHDDGRQFVFASEAKAILAAGITARLNRVSAKIWLQQSWVDRSNASFVDGVVLLPAAHYLMADANGLVVKRYWRLPADEEREEHPDPAGQFAELFRDAVTLRLQTDVPLGISISGGMDSTAVAVVMAADIAAAARSQVTMKGFHVTAQGDPDITYARLVAQRHGFHMTEAEITPAVAAGLFMAALRSEEAPIADASVLSQHRLMQLVNAAGIRVLLTGAGSDEYLSGYQNYYYYYYEELLRARRWLRLAREVAVRGALLLREYDPYALTYGWSVVRRLGRRRRAAGGGAAAALASPVHSGLQEKLRHSVEIDSLPEQLRYEDRASMQYSVEAREPFLDHRLLEFAFRQPSEWIIRDGRPKHLLRAALGAAMPAEIMARVRKNGYVQIGEHWREALWREYSDLAVSVADCEELTGKRWPAENAATRWRRLALGSVMQTMGMQP